jgi:signal transduction histidine kinase
MERMCELVRVAMQATPGSLGSASMGLTSPLTLGAALTHAVEVLGPMASDHRVNLEARLSPEIEQLSAGPVYTVVFNAVRNGIESIARAGRPGHIFVRACIRGNGPTGRWVQIEVRDDGEGPPTDRPTGRLFDFGVTTKAGGSGIGLALASEIVRELGGVIELIPAIAHAPPGHRGAVVTIAYPIADAAPNANGDSA